jgi:hypothetical protein
MLMFALRLGRALWGWVATAGSCWRGPRLALLGSRAEELSRACFQDCSVLPAPLLAPSRVLVPERAAGVLAGVLAPAHVLGI